MRPQTQSPITRPRGSIFEWLDPVIRSHRDKRSPSGPHSQKMRKLHPFLRATTPDNEDGVRRLRFEESWYQGRGVYGGVLAGAFARDMAATLGTGEDDRPLRWMTVHFCAPATGIAVIETKTARRGSSVTHLRAEILREEDVIAFASATFARARPSEFAWRRPTMPRVLAPETIDPFAATPAPTFTSNLELRFCHGAKPLSGSEQTEIGVWIRFREPLLVDTAAALALLDAAPPAAMARFNSLRPMATVALSCQFFHTLPLADARPDDHYLFVVRSNVCADGYAEELGELWSRQGHLIALCWQTVALLG
ncbi:MAG TPA: thioesterase family protein [Nannocystis exedens]|nr:thioesterase family protein [Nannocystis exedens]